ncbi:hypothetical protein BBK82_45830 [Lentzea guizhouensis]|uniref:Uncharacterized protein n=1 Tax=Lentzea guizhouensis TaxID=1586287 RepID=A0A1B2HWU3_9PSEU|nr:hypothetical protein BBK82_45830 [Lentzea guizhouensis]
MPFGDFALDRPLGQMPFVDIARVVLLSAHDSHCSLCRKCQDRVAWVVFLGGITARQFGVGFA